MNRIAVLGGLAIAVAVAAFLRFDGLGVPSYWLDEVLGRLVVERVPTLPWWRWLTGVHPQHGPLYYALQWLASAVRDDEWGGRLFAASFGVIAVPLLWVCARATRAGWPLLAAALLAVSPLHVYYSREARPYALLVLLVLVALLAILDRRPWLAGGALLLMLYTSVAAASAVAAMACAAFAASWLERDAHGRRRLVVIAVLAVLVLALFPLFYRAPAEEGVVSPFPGLTASLFDSIVRGLAVTALDSDRAGRAAYAVLVLVIVGAAALFRRNASAAAAVIAMAFLPVAFSIAGLLAQNHFFGIRYVIAALPAYLLLAGVGIATILPWRKVPLALAAVVVLAWQSWPMARAEAFRKLDWRGVAQRIHHYAQPDDVVITAEPWSGLVLHYYLERLPPKVLDLQLSTAPLAEVAVQEHAAAWLVSGGFNPDVEVRRWMCGFPVILGSPLENFRMHYTSRTGGNFLRERAREPELRAVAAAEGLLFGEGWAGPEGSFRWAVGRRAEIFLPRFGREDRTLRLRVNPLDHPSLPPQTMRITLNGRELQTLTLPPGWQELSVPAPAAAWRDGLNALAFEFGRATAPAELDPVNRDPRKLAVAFEWTVPAIAVRLPPLPEKRTFMETRLPADRLDRARVETLLGRIGLDPAANWPKLARGEARLEDLVQTVTYGTDCLDDRAFARETFTLLLGRPPGEAELRSILPVPRARLAERITRFEEFRRNVAKSH